MYSSQLLKYLKSSSASFCGSKIPFSLTKFYTTNNNKETFRYMGESVLLSQEFIIKKHKYTTVAFSNPPYAFIKPAIFDNLFADEIEDLKRVYKKNGNINKRKSRKLFAHFVRQPVLDKSLKDIVKLRKEIKQDESKDLTNSTQVIIQACLGYISKNSAEILGHSINKLLNKISPVSSSLIWGIGGGIVILILALFLEIFAETGGRFFHMLDFIERQELYTYIKSRHWVSGKVFFTLFIFLIGALFTALASTIIFSTATFLFIKLKQLSVPKPYRQKIRSWKPLKTYLKTSTLIFVISLSYGYLAFGNILPKLNMVNLVDTEQKLKVCQLLLDKEIKTTTCNSIIKNVLLLNSKGEKISDYHMASDIQYFLNENGYRISSDGTYGKETESALLDFFHKHNIKYNPNEQSLDDRYRQLNTVQF